MFQTKNT